MERDEIKDHLPGFRITLNVIALWSLFLLYCFLKLRQILSINDILVGLRPQLQRERICFGLEPLIFRQHTKPFN